MLALVFYEASGVIFTRRLFNPIGREDSSKSFPSNPKFKEINCLFRDRLNDLVCNLVPQNLTTILPSNLAVLRTLANYY